MILNYKQNGKCPTYPDQLDWVKSFAWLPTTVDDGRIVWLEYVMKLTRTRKYPTDYIQQITYK
jgi:hypothetical protein